jgi:ribulose-phosphate 3-epimerase
MKYLCDPRILPTNTCPPDLVELARRTESVLDFAPEIQLDVADGAFAPVTSWPYIDTQMEALEAMAERGERLPHADHMRYEVHLMVNEPEHIGALLAKVGCVRILAHIETIADVSSAQRMFTLWKESGAQEVGVSLLIDTPLDTIAPYCDMISVVQLMSIAKVGAQGQPFDERIYSRVEEVHAVYPDLMVAVDGGVSESNVESLTRAGANRLCVGSGISKAEDPAGAYAALLARATQGCKPVTVSIDA